MTTVNSCSNKEEKSGEDGCNNCANQSGSGCSNPINQVPVIRIQSISVGNHCSPWLVCGDVYGGTVTIEPDKCNSASDESSCQVSAPISATVQVMILAAKFELSLSAS
jgi:hypothetical protein